MESERVRERDMDWSEKEKEDTLEGEGGWVGGKERKMDCGERKKEGKNIAERKKTD